ncbi:7TM GPCR serpentine receptor class x (Srx) domain-containing protein [Caenorhabditis elegans]|uniref:7TM GPCR serpentine receptor class x (Srx) domain-containing protein n=1 Tax=Caenorhabditis elegans TaxID=6239 RepID=P90816_CAEEL|nr:7TM GPCR serpentine receptor class x (Srx) domain-containing protein [Caenorhabditis elegans]CAB02901.2 7TM GPCR serpentine receptor class x (Srx) domain-containing protein [Caenorhabditis elegans]|eukprot:NP_506429.2 Serpentine Receptor, class X [Caenorhabditis elegans]
MEVIDQPVSAILAKQFFIFALLFTFSISFLGSICNLYLFYKFVTRASKPSGFQKLCTMKTFTNCTICMSFLFWVVPITGLSLTFNQLNKFFNQLIGVMAATWAYFTNSLLTICLSSNRFYCLYFPFGIKFLIGIPITTCAISAVLFITLAISVLSLIAGCSCIFDPNIFIWTGKGTLCEEYASIYVPAFIFVTTAITNSINIMTAVRLFMEKLTSLGVVESKRRRKRWIIMFSQNVVQDCLQLIDIINSYYLCKLNEDLWFQIVTVTFSFLTITALDGFVMFVFQEDIHPKFLKQVLRKYIGCKNSVGVFQSVGNTSFVNSPV